MKSAWFTVSIASIGMLGVAAPQAQAEQCTLAALKWLAGTWHNSENPTGAQERWAIAPGGVLMGSAWEFPPGKTGYAEILTISSEQGSVSMFLRHFDAGLAHAWEERGDPMVFAATDCEDQKAIFSGQAAHAGERLTYVRSGERLEILADFLHQGKAVHVEFHMIRAGE
jgi:hypothetical protein